MPSSKKSPGTRHSGRWGALSGIIVLIALILIIPLFFTIPMRAVAPATALPPTPYTLVPPTATPLVSTPSGPPSSRPAGHRPPACTFPLAQTTTSTTTRQNYAFSDPVEPVPPEGMWVKIVGWLPDSQRVLLVRQFAGDDDERIELFEPAKGTFKTYARRTPTQDLPAWLPAIDAVVYSKTTLLKAAQQNGVALPPYEYRRQLLVSRGDPAPTLPIENAHLAGRHMSSFTVAVEPRGGQFAYLTGTDKQLSKRGASLANLSHVAFDAAYWDYRGERGPSQTLRELRLMAWRPGTSQIFLYSWAYGGLGYTFLLDSDTGQVCELELNGWAFTARWSPDGHYLAIVRAQEPTYPTSSTDLAVLDAATGKLYAMQVVPQEAVGRHYVLDIAWAPDNHHLLVLGAIASYPGCSSNCSEDTRLYLTDFLDDRVNALLPSQRFGAISPGGDLAWSPDGSKVLALCPNLCLISVSATNP